MNILQTILILVAAFLAIFAEATFPVLRHWLGAQVDLLPVLMVYAALNLDIVAVALLAVLGGMGFDALSANPLGISILPLYAVGFLVHLRRDLILREVSFAQLVLGTVASAVVPALTLLFLLTIGKQPLLGWGTIWQWMVMTAGGAAATPAVFALFNWCNHALGYQPRTETSFRPDREIRRGRL